MSNCTYHFFFLTKCLNKEYIINSANETIKYNATKLVKHKR